MFKKRFRGGSIRKRRPVQWVTSDAWYGNTPQAVAAATLFSSQVIGTGKSSLTTGGDTYIMAQRVTVLRIVGEVLFNNTDAAALNYYTWGLILSDESGGLVTNYDPSLASNADKSWLTLRHGVCDQVAVAYDNSNQKHLPSGAHVDVRVKRVLRPDQRIEFFLISSTTGNVVLNLRCLVSRVA